MTQAVTIVKRERMEEITTFIHGYRDQFAGLVSDKELRLQMFRTFTTEVAQKPKVAACTNASLLSCFILMLQLKASTAAGMKEMHIVPFGDQATPIWDYQFLVKLAVQHPLVDHVVARPVFKQDDFEWEYGTNEHIYHKPGEDVTGDPSEMTHAYAQAFLKGSSHPVFIVWTRKQIERHRDRYSKNSKGSDSPWITAPESMWKKTVLKQLMKFVPRTNEMSVALAVDDAVQSGQSYADVIELPPEATQTSTAGVQGLKEKVSKFKKIDTEKYPPVDGEPPDETGQTESDKFAEEFGQKEQF